MWHYTFFLTCSQFSKDDTEFLNNCQQFVNEDEKFVKKAVWYIAIKVEEMVRRTKV